MGSECNVMLIRRWFDCLSFQIIIRFAACMFPIMQCLLVGLTTFSQHQIWSRIYVHVTCICVHMCGAESLVHAGLWHTPSSLSPKAANLIICCQIMSVMGLTLVALWDQLVTWSLAHILESQKHFSRHEAQISEQFICLSCLINLNQLRTCVGKRLHKNHLYINHIRPANRMNYELWIPIIQSQMLIHSPLFLNMEPDHMWSLQGMGAPCKAPSGVMLTKIWGQISKTDRMST